MTRTLTYGSIGILCVLALIGGAAAFSRAATLNPIATTLDVGSSGQEVTNLQTFLATNSLVYPAGIVSGYYGPLTHTAVAQFQIGYGLPPVGRVGPLTLAKMNQIISSGGALDVSAPATTGTSITTSGSVATLSWQTNEAAFGSVHYDTAPIVMQETATAHQEPQSSGQFSTETGASVPHSITLSNLAPHQLYFVILESRDLTGNISVTQPMTFVTP